MRCATALLIHVFTGENFETRKRALALLRPLQTSKLDYALSRCLRVSCNPQAAHPPPTAHLAHMRLSARVMRFPDSVHDDGEARNGFQEVHNYKHPVFPPEFDTPFTAWAIELLVWLWLCAFHVDTALMMRLCTGCVCL